MNLGFQTVGVLFLIHFFFFSLVKEPVAADLVHNVPSRADY